MATPHGTVRRSRAGPILVTLFLLASALASALFVGEARPAREASGLIAFVRADGIYVMRTDGSRVHRTLRHHMRLRPYPGAGLAWSRDGRKLAFTDSDTVWAVDADGSHLVALVSASSPPSASNGLFTTVLSPTWSPDGRRIAFVGYREGDPDMDVWVVDSDGGNLQRLARTPDRSEIEVDWSPNGLRLAIEAGGYVPKVYVTDLAGNILRTLAPAQSFMALEPAWGPGGRRIAFTRYQDGHSTDEIYVADVGRPSYRRLTHNTDMDRSPTWSPDASKIAFVRGVEDVADSLEIYVINANGTGLRRLTHNQVLDASPAWRPVAAP